MARRTRARSRRRWSAASRSGSSRELRLRASVRKENPIMPWALAFSHSGREQGEIQTSW